MAINTFPAIPATVQGLNAPAAGRVNTYFNSPYAAGIANNLSAAIYGDPQADMTRQQIKVSQENMARQKEQDAIAAQDKARSRQLQEELGAVLATGGDLTKAIPAYIQGGGSLSDALSLMALEDDPRYQKKIGGLEAAGRIERGNYRDRASVDQPHDVRMLGLEAGVDAEAATTQHGRDREEAQLGRAQDLLSETYGMGYQLPGVSEAPGYLPEGMTGKPGWLWPTEDPTSHYYRGSGSGSKPPAPPNGTQLKAFADDLTAEVATMAGGVENIGSVVDPQQWQEFMARAKQIYGETGNAPAAQAQAMQEFGIEFTPGEENMLWPDVPAKMSITPNSQQGPVGSPISTGQFAGHIKGDDGKVYNDKGVAVARWK